MMKALFSRFNRGTSKEKRDSEPTQLHKEKLPQLPPLPDWPPSSSPSTFKPLPDVNSRPLHISHNFHPPTSPTSPTSPLIPFTPTSPRTTSPTLHRTSIPSEDTTSNADTYVASRHEQEYSNRTSRKAPSTSVSTTSDAHKKVAFISPTPTPSALDRTISEPSHTGKSPVLPQQSSAPAKTTLSRFQAAHGKDPRGSTSSAASSSKTDVASTKVSVKATSVRGAPSPTPSRALDTASIQQSLRSGTPYSQMSNNSSRILAAASWSEGAEEDLVSNLGPRERTRQEVLWEIVASEERFVR